MEKSSIEMELGEWELIPSNNNHTYIDLGVENLKGVINIDYFELREPAKECLIVQKKQRDPQDQEFKDICIVPSLLLPPPPSSLIIVDHHDSPNRVFFDKLKDDDKFVDVTVESPKSHNQGIIAPAMEPEPLSLEEEEEFYRDEKKYSASLEKEKEEKPCREGFGLRIWRWGAAGGVGALCSIGVAAASLCIFMLGGRHTEIKHDQPRSQKVQFKIYADEKQIKQVMQQATRMNQALSAVRSGPVNWANISFGGYYDAL